jgi:hypothetical protein
MLARNNPERFDMVVPAFIGIVTIDEPERSPGMSQLTFHNVQPASVVLESVGKSFDNVAELVFIGDHDGESDN